LTAGAFRQEILMIEDKQLLALALFILFFSEATNATNSLSSQVSASAYTRHSSQADLMFPLNSNNTHNFYANPSWLMVLIIKVTLDLGYRWIKNNAAILGLFIWWLYAH